MNASSGTKEVRNVNGWHKRIDYLIFGFHSFTNPVFETECKIQRLMYM